MSGTSPGGAGLFGLLHLPDLVSPEVLSLPPLAFKAYMLLTAVANQEHGRSFVMAHWQACKLLECSRSGWRKAVAELAERELVTVHTRTWRRGDGAQEFSPDELERADVNGSMHVRQGKTVTVAPHTRRLCPSGTGEQSWNRYSVHAPKTAQRAGFVYPRNNKNAPIWVEPDEVSTPKTENVDTSTEDEHQVSPQGHPGCPGQGHPRVSHPRTPSDRSCSTGDPDKVAPPTPSHSAAAANGGPPLPSGEGDGANVDAPSPRRPRERPRRREEDEDLGRFAAAAFDAAVGDLVDELAAESDDSGALQRVQAAIEAKARSLRRVDGERVAATRRHARERYPGVPGRRKTIIKLWRRIAAMVAELDPDVVAHRARVERERRIEERRRTEAQIRTYQAEAAAGDASAELDRAIRRDELAARCEQLVDGWLTVRGAAEGELVEFEAKPPDVDKRRRIVTQRRITWRIDVARAVLARLSSLLDALQSSAELTRLETIIYRAPNPDLPVDNAAQWAGMR